MMLVYKHRKTIRKYIPQTLHSEVFSGSGVKKNFHFPWIPASRMFVYLLLLVCQFYKLQMIFKSLSVFREINKQNGPLLKKKIPRSNKSAHILGNMWVCDHFGV